MKWIFLVILVLNIIFFLVIEKVVVYFCFEYILKVNIIVDEFQFYNDVKIVNFVRIVQFSERCGNGVDFNGGDILLNGFFFQ